MKNVVLKVDSSARVDNSATREITDYLVSQLQNDRTYGDVDSVITRDLRTSTLPLLSPELIGAYFTPPDQRTSEQEQLLRPSNEMVDELRQARQLVIGASMYNFTVSASLKAWIDLICRVGETFVYSSEGPQGLLSVERAFIVVASGGTEIGSTIDFCSDYLEHICHFLGIETVHIISVPGPDDAKAEAIEHARELVDDLVGEHVAA